MEQLFVRHDDYISSVPMGYIREISNTIEWNARLIALRGPKGVGKTTLMQQYIRLHYSPEDRHVLYCSADTGYFATHTLTEVADQFARKGGTHLFIDEVHKYDGWSTEIKDIYDRHRDLRIVLSGSSLLQLNDGEADLSRRLLFYDIPGLSFREFLRLETGIEIRAIRLEDLLSAPNEFCSLVRSKCHPAEFFHKYLSEGYYPYYFEGKKIYHALLENMVNYVIDVELTRYRKLDVGNTRAVRALLQVISQMVPYDVDIAKLSRSISIARNTTLTYLKHLEEACLIIRLFADIDSIGDLQKPDKIYLNNPNLLYALSPIVPEIGTVRETFFVNQIASIGHRVEYAGYHKGDFLIDRQITIEVGGPDKNYEQVEGNEQAYIAADDIDSAIGHKIPLWAFGFLY